MKEYYLEDYSTADYSTGHKPKKDRSAYFKAYRAAHKEQDRQAQARYRERNLEERRRQSREYSKHYYREHRIDKLKYAAERNRRLNENL